MQDVTATIIDLSARIDLRRYGTVSGLRTCLVEDDKKGYVRAWLVLKAAATIRPEDLLRLTARVQDRPARFDRTVPVFEPQWDVRHGDWLLVTGWCYAHTGISYLEADATLTLLSPSGTTLASCPFFPAKPSR